MGRHGAYTNSYISRRQDDLITQQAAKTKEQAATAEKLTAQGHVQRNSASRDSHVKHDCINARKH